MIIENRLVKYFHHREHPSSLHFSLHFVTPRQDAETSRAHREKTNDFFIKNINHMLFNPFTLCNLLYLLLHMGEIRRIFNWVSVWDKTRSL